MLYQLIDFNHKEISNYNLVFKHSKWTYYLFITFFIMFFISLFFVILAIINHKFIITSIIISLLILGIGLLLFLKLNSNAKKILEEKYSITSNNFLWNNSDYFKMRKDIIIDYLKENNLYHKDKLKLLIDLLNKEYRNGLPKPYITSGVLVSLLLPLWVSFINKSFEYVNTTETVYTTFNSLIAIALAIFVCIFVIRLMYTSYREIFIDILYKKNINTKHLAQEIEHIILEYPIEKRENEPSKP